MLLQASYDVILHFAHAIRVAFWPTLLAIWKSPTLLLDLPKFYQLLFAKIWVGFGPAADDYWKDIKGKLITPNAYGVVLDIGAGYGCTIKYLDKTKVTKYVALEPNANFHDEIRLAASKEGYSEADGTFLVLPYGIENASLILSALHDHRVDTIVSIFVLCTVPDPQRSISKLIIDTLTSGGVFLYFEHVLSSRRDVAWWQRVWAPIWAFGFDGCRMERPSHLYVDQVHGKDGESVWREREVGEVQGEVESALHLFEHRIGRYIKV